MCLDFMRAGDVSDRSMFTDIQAASQISMGKWLTGIPACLGVEAFPGPQDHQSIGRIGIFTLAA